MLTCIGFVVLNDTNILCVMNGEDVVILLDRHNLHSRHY